MEEDSIRISEKHGVNPSILQCEICGKEFGIALHGKLKGDIEAPKVMTYHGCWCDECKKIIEEQDGMYIIEIRNGEEKKENPFRTGRIVAVKKSTFKDVEAPVVYMVEEEFNKMFGHIVNKDC